MSEDRKMDASARRKRVRRLKRLIIFTLLALICAPIVCCVVLMFQVQSLNRRIDGLSQRLTALEESDRLQALLTDDMESFFGLTADVGQGDALEAGALPDGGVGKSFSEPESKEFAEDQEEVPRKVYLTFDDGPSIYTDEILEILEEYDVKGTFFVVGKEDERSKEAILKIVEAGHTLGMHSYSHKYSELYASTESFAADFEKQRSFLEELTGQTCRFYRFPGGSSNTVSKVDMQQFADYLEEQDMVFYDWNISSGDGGGQLLSVDTLVRNSTSDLGEWKTAVILMHDSADKPTTVEALPQIIEKILAMEDTVILPITDDTQPVQHIH